MKRIAKTIEPKSLTTYRGTISHKNLEDSNIYEDYQEKTKEQCIKSIPNTLRKQLLVEQGYICCYCMSRIDCDNSKIEHFKPQSKYKALQIDYQNIFISCIGGEGNIGKRQFCDTKKGEDKLLAVDLLSNIENRITYQKSAKNITINSQDIDISSDINKTLNLNIDLLQKNRKQAYDRTIQNLKSKGYTIQNIKKTLMFYKSKHNGKFEPYSNMVIYFLTKKLNSKGII